MFPCCNLIVQSQTTCRDLVRYILLARQSFEKATQIKQSLDLSRVCLFQVTRCYTGDAVRRYSSGEACQYDEQLPPSQRNTTIC